MKKIILIVILLFITINVKAYENNIFSINVDEKYKLTLENKNAYRWTKDNNYIAISISDNSKLKYDVKNYTDEDIENQKKYFEEGINNGISKYNITATINEVKKLNNNENYYLEYDIYYPSKKNIGYDMYQKGRMYTTNKYIVTIIYSSDKSLEKNNEYENILNSLTIFDKNEVVKRNDNLIIYFLIIIGVVSGIIGAIISTKKNANK